jgi:hypothetical protein
MRRYSMAVGLCLTTLLTLSPAAVLVAQDFVLQVGPAIAGKTPSAKKSLFVVRPGGCADPARAKITATAEGIVNGARRSVPVTLAALPTPGVHAVPRDWPAGGVWIVNLVGTCDGRTAGALVPVAENATYARESIKLLAHKATSQEIDASLKALTAGGSK